MSSNSNDNMTIVVSMFVIMMGLATCIMVAQNIVVDYTDCIKHIHAEIPLVYANQFPTALDLGDTTSSICQQK